MFARKIYIGLIICSCYLFIGKLLNIGRILIKISVKDFKEDLFIIDNLLYQVCMDRISLPWM